MLQMTLWNGYKNASITVEIVILDVHHTRLN